LKIKKFTLDKGKNVVTVSYTNINDTTKAEDDTTLKTNEGPVPQLREAWQTLALAAREYWGLTELKLRVSVLVFTENNDGRGARLSMESVDDEHPLFIGPLRVKREPDLMPSTNDLDPNSLKNPLLDAIDLVENKISEYISGQREQPKLIEKPEGAQPELEPEARPRGYLGEKIAQAAKAIGGRSKKAAAPKEA
jgi:hypothetical protein